MFSGQSVIGKVDVYFHMVYHSWKHGFLVNLCIVSNFTLLGSEGLLSYNYGFASDELLMVKIILCTVGRREH